MKRELLPQIFITLLGAALILWGAGKIALGIIGEPEKVAALLSHCYPDQPELRNAFSRKAGRIRTSRTARLWGQRRIKMISTESIMAINKSEIQEASKALKFF